MNSLIGNLKNKRVLVTGGSGFIGKILIPRMRPLCRDFHIYEKDIREIANYKRRYDIVCHLAALNKPGDKKGDMREMFDINVNGTVSVMRYCRRNDAKCVLASSSAVYAPLAFNKTIAESSPLKPVLAYGVSKMLAENICKSYGEDFGICAMALRMFNIYGPGQKEPFLLPYLINQIRKRKAIGLKTPMAVRDFIHIADVVNAFILACAYTRRGFMTLNIGMGHGISVFEIAQKIAILMKTKPIFSNTATVDCGADYVIADINNIKKILKWHPAIDLDEGLKLFMRKR